MSDHAPASTPDPDETPADAPAPVADAPETTPAPEAAAAPAVDAPKTADVPDADAPAETAADDAAPSDEAPSGPTFADLGLHPELLAALTKLGYEEPTPIQRESIGPLLQRRDVLGQAATGTGKTAAFALPLLHRLAKGERWGTKPRAIVLAPTRELAMQVSEAMHSYGSGLGLKVLPVFGGQPIFRQIKALERGVDVVVATPGRATDLIKRRSLDLQGVEMVVLDEADEMMDMGFQEDLEAILDATPKSRQTVLFSATMPTRIERLARSHQDDPVRIRLAREETPEGEAPRVRQTAYVVARAHKAAALTRVLDQESPAAAIVFCRTRAEVDEVTQTLNGRGYTAEALHGGMDQTQRSRTIDRLRAGTTELLIATDVAARGLDIDTLSHVVNYDVPSSPETYVHRIGRVGRAGREGVAITFAQPREHRMLKAIERLTKQEIAVERVPTVADVRARRLDLTRAALREVLLEEDGLDAVRGVVEELADEFDVMDVAAAAVRLAQESQGGVPGDEEEIPDASMPRERRRDRDDRPGRGDRGERRERPDRPRREHAGGPDGETTRLFVGAGRAARIRPQDLVGAITGETSLSGRDIGAIQIHERFSLVEVPAGAADEVIAGLGGTHLKGKRPQVRRERF